MSYRAVLVAWAYLVVLVTRSNCWDDNDFNGISQVALVVEDLQEATNFYTGLGGMLVEKLSTDGIFGDSHYYRLFQTQILAAQNDPQSTLEDLGVLDISDSGNWKLRWNMIMFGNIMIQLMQFVDRNNANVVWKTPHPDGNGAAFTTLQHACMWGRSNVNLSVIAEDLRASAGLGSGYTKPLIFNSGTSVETRQEMYDLPISSLVQFGGEALISDGTQSERLELTITTTEDRILGHLKVFCESYSPSPMVVDSWKSDRTMIESWNGIHHLGVVVNNFDDSTKFYTEVLGGKYSFGFAYPPGLGEFQDDLFDAAENSKTAEEWGIPDLANSNTRQRLAFVAFENTYLETNYFYQDDGSNNPDNGTPTPFNWASLSPAYTRTFMIGFGVKTGKNLNSVVQDIEEKSAARGMSQVRGNRAISVTSADQTVALSDYSEELTEGDLEGYNYVLLRGPSQEPLFIVSYSGKALAALKEAMIQYDAKSGRFDETNPWKQDGFKSQMCCDTFNVCTIGSSSGIATLPSVFVLTVVTLAAFLNFV